MIINDNQWQSLIIIDNQSINLTKLVGEKIDTIYTSDTSNTSDTSDTSNTSNTSNTEYLHLFSADWTSSRPRKRRICRSATPFSFIRIKLSRALTNQTLDCRSISQSDKWTSVHPLPDIFISQPPPTMLHILKYQGSSEHTVILLRELILCHFF